MDLWQSGLLTPTFDLRGWWVASRGGMGVLAGGVGVGGAVESGSVVAAVPALRPSAERCLTHRRVPDKSGTRH